MWPRWQTSLGWSMFVKMTCLLSSQNLSMTMLTWATRHQDLGTLGSYSVLYVQRHTRHPASISCSFAVQFRSLELQLVFSRSSQFWHWKVSVWRMPLWSLWMVWTQTGRQCPCHPTLRGPDAWMTWDQSGSLDGELVSLHFYLIFISFLWLQSRTII